jgi:hypothetical protein
MFKLARLLDADWPAVHHFLEMRRAFRGRDAAEDARRAQESRLTLIQFGLPFGNHSRSAPGSSLKRTDSSRATSL